MESAVAEFTCGESNQSSKKMDDFISFFFYPVDHKNLHYMVHFDTQKDTFAISLFPHFAK